MTYAVGQRTQEIGVRMALRAQRRTILWMVSPEILMSELFSVSEAAAIAEGSPETIRTVLEKKSVAPSSKRKTGNALRYQFSVGDGLFMKVLVEFPFALSKEDKQSLATILSREIRRRPAGREKVRT